MLEIEALRQLLFEKGIITKDEFIAKFKKLDREMKEKRGRLVNLLQEIHFDTFGEGMENEER